MHRGKGRARKTKEQGTELLCAWNEPRSLDAVFGVTAEGGRFWRRWARKGRISCSGSCAFSKWQKTVPSGLDAGVSSGLSDDGGVWFLLWGEPGRVSWFWFWFWVWVWVWFWV
jgi:hypothetical protein